MSRRCRSCGCSRLCVAVAVAVGVAAAVAVAVGVAVAVADGVAVGVGVGVAVRFGMKVYPCATSIRLNSTPPMPPTDGTALAGCCKRHRAGGNFVETIVNRARLVDVCEWDVNRDRAVRAKR